MRRVVVNVLALALVLVSGLPPTAEALGKGETDAPPVLAGKVTIDWTGVKGIELTVPAPTPASELPARLYRHGSSYAFVRLVVPGERPCYDPARAPEPNCDTWVIDSIRLKGRKSSPDAGPAFVPLGDVIPAGKVRLYLFAEESATLVLGKGPIGNRYSATDSIEGGAVPIPITCAPDPCGPSNASNGVATGSESVLIPSDGYVSLVVAWVPRPTYAQEQEIPLGQNIATCLQPTESSAPSECQPPSGLMRCEPGCIEGGNQYEWRTDATGDYSAGFKAIGAANYAAYALWYTYPSG